MASGQPRAGEGGGSETQGLGAGATLPRPQVGFQWLLDSTKARACAQEDGARLTTSSPSPTAAGPWALCLVESTPLSFSSYCPWLQGLPLPSSDPQPSSSQGRKGSPVENSQQGSNLIAALHPQWPDPPRDPVTASLIPAARSNGAPCSMQPHPGLAPSYPVPALVGSPGSSLSYMCPWLGRQQEGWKGQGVRLGGTP